MMTERRLKHAIGGLFITTIGVLLLLNRMGVVFPVWFLTWQMLLISIGAYKLIVSQFKSVGGMILTLVGLVFLTELIYPTFTIRDFIWPIALIFVGILMMFRTKKDENNKWFSAKCGNYKFKNSKFTSYEN